MKLKKIRNEILFVTSAIVVAIAIAEKEADANKLIDVEDMIACIPVNAEGTVPNAQRSTQIRSTDNDHNRKSDGNGCPHQQPGSGMLCNSNAYQNRFNKIPTC